MYYDGANWKWDKGDEMIDANFAKQIIADLDRIKETLQEIQGSGKVEKKEQMKLWEIMENNFLHPDGYPESYKQASRAAIDAVIECFDEWINNCQQPRPFPEYLKEKML